MKVGIVGQIAPHKGHDDVLEVLRLVPEVECLIFGSGDPVYIASLMGKALGYGISERIRWCGFIYDQADIYPRFDVLLVPSKCDEAFCMVAAEAQVYGKPVIAYRRGALPEVVQDGVTGFIVDTPQEMADKLRLLI